MSRPLTIERLWSLDRVGAIALSPDGTQVVCAVAHPNLDENKTVHALWRLPSDGGRARRLTTGGEKDGQPAWSPQGDRLAFVGRRTQGGVEDKTPQLYVLPAAGGEARRASRYTPGVECFKWLPDGRRVVFAAWVWPDLKGAAAQAKRHAAWTERKETGHATASGYYRHWDHAVPQDRVLHLHLLDLDSGRVTDLFEGTALELTRDGPNVDDFDVAPDGRRVAFVHDPSPDPRAGQRRRLSVLDLRTKRVSPLADDPAWDFAAPAWSPDGRQLAAIAANTGRVHTALGQLALVTPGRGWRSVSAAWDREVLPPLRWAPAGDAVCFTAEDRGRCHLWRHALDADTPTVLHAGGWVQAFAFAGRTLACVADGASHPPRVFAAADGGAPRRVDGFNDRQLTGVAFGEVRETTVTGALGEPVQAWLVFPPGFDATQRHPVLQVIHGGPHAASGDSWSWRWNPHLLASRGHVVAQVNFHGSSGFGHAFRHSLVGRMGQLELQDIEAVTGWLRRQRWVDKARIDAAGASYGGFLVAWLNGHVAPGRYRRLVCHAGVFDRVATFAADSYVERPRDLGAWYWDDLPKVLAQSPMAFAGRMQTPTLVTHGALDFRVPDTNGLAFYNTLKARGVEARLLWFPDENHWVLKPRNSRQWYEEVLAWLAP